MARGELRKVMNLPHRMKNRRGPFLSIETATITSSVGFLFDHLEAQRVAEKPEFEFAIAGRQFAGFVKSHDYVQHLKKAFREQSSSGSRTNVIVTNREDAPDLHWPVWTEKWFHHRRTEAALKDSPFRLHYFPDLDFWQFYDRDRQLGLQLMAQPGSFPEWDPGAPIKNFAHWRLLDDCASLVHAGTLGCDGHGVLLAGAGGSGKSGTVISGLLNGLQSVGDDYVAVELGNSVSAHRAFQILKQDTPGLVRAGMPAIPSSPVNWQGKHSLDIDAIARVPLPTELAVRAICLPEVTQADRTTFRPTGGQDAFLALAPSGINQIPCCGPETFKFAAELSRSLPVYRVSLGTNPVEIADAFADFITGCNP